MPKTYQKWFIRAGLLAAVLAAVAAGASVYLSSAAFQDRLLDIVNMKIPGKISLDRFKLRLLPAEIVLIDLRLVDANDLLLAKAGQVKVGFSWMPLLRRQIHITELIVEQAETDLTFDDQDRLALAAALKPTDETKENGRKTAPSSNWGLLVSEMDIKFDRIGFHRPSMELNAAAEQLDLNGHLNLQQPAGRLRLELSHIQFQMGRRAGAIGPAVAQLVYDARSDHPLSVDLQVQHSQLQAAAKPVWSDPMQDLDVVIDYHIVLEDFAPWLPSDPKFTGTLSGQALIKGSAYDPTVSLKLQMGPATLAGVDAQNVTVRLGLEQRIMTIAQLRGQGAWGQVALEGRLDLRSMFSADFRQMTGGLGNLEYDLRLKFEELRPHLLSLTDFPIQGTWQGRATLHGKGLGDADASGQADIEIGGLLRETPTSEPVEPVRATLNTHLHWQGRRIEFSGTKATAGPTQVALSGGIDLANGQLFGQGKLRSDQISALESIIGHTLPSGHGEFSFDCAGSLDQPEIRGRIMAQDLAFEGFDFGQVMLKAEIDRRGRLLISDMMLQNQGSLITGSGQLDLLRPDGSIPSEPHVSARLDFEQLQLSDFGLMEVLKGHLKGRLEVSGMLNNPRAELILDQSPLVWQGFSGLAAGLARWHNGLLEVQRLRLTKGTSKLDLSGRLAWYDASSGRWSAEPNLDVRAECQGLELADIRENVKGRVTLQAVVQGSASELQGRFELQAQEVDSGVQKFNLIVAKGRLAENILQLDQLDIELAPGQGFQGHGWYGFDHRFALSLAGDALELRQVDTLQQAYPVDGRLSFTLNGSGTLAQPTVEVSMVVAGPRLNDQVFNDFKADMTLEGHDLTLHGDLNFKAQAHIRLDTGAYTVLADFDHTDLTPYLALWMGPLWSGQLSGHLQAVGNWHVPEQTSGAVVLNHGALAYEKHPLVSTVNLHATLQNNRLSIPSARLTFLDTGFMEVEADGDIARDIQARISGRVPLPALAPFTEALSDVNGAVVLQANFQGPISKPSWQADLTLEDVAFVVPELLQGVENVNGTIRLRPQTIAVEKVAGRLGTGRFELQGGIQLDEWKPTGGQVRLSLQSLPIQWPGTMDMVIGGDLALQGSPAQAVVSGDLVLVEGLYYKDVRLNLLSGIIQPRRVQEGNIPRPKPDWMRCIAMDVKVHHRNPFLVDNNLARLEVVPDFHLTGTLANPVMSGRAQVTEGELMYGRKTFIVQRGVVDFINPNKIEPTLDISGQVQFRKWLIKLGVSGTPDRLAFTLTSDPPESDNDILSLLLLGRTNAEMTQGQGSGRQTTQQMLAQLAASTWGEDIKRTAGVDIFEVGAGSDEQVDDPNSMQLTVGKRLSRRLTIKYDVESQEGEMVQRTVSEYRFLEHVLATGFQDSKGNYGGELLFRMDFR